MRANPARNRLVFKQYYVQPWLYKVEEKKNIADNFEIENVSDVELSNRKSDFEREAIPHMKLLYNYAMKISGDRLDADDLIQETYLRAYRFYHTFKKGTNCKAWLYRIMKNCYINKYRKDKKEPSMVDYDEIPNFYDSIRKDAVAINNLEFEIYSKLFDDELTSALSSLKDEYKTVLILCDLEGLSYEEIAEFLNIPVGTVRSRIFRSRKILQQKLYRYALSRGFTSDNSFSNN
jgi:RNA polymerase sigma-70 factor (ECF subfamily)